MIELLREGAVILGFVCSLIYFTLYLFNPHRDRSMVSNMLLHLGVVQILAYGNGILRLVVFGPGARTPGEQGILAMTNVAALSLSAWVLLAYVMVQRDAARERNEESGRR